MVIRRAPLVIWPYKLSSESARLLASNLREKLGRRVLRVTPNGRFISKSSDWILNWGCSNEPNWRYDSNRIFNKPESVAKAANKLKTFNTLATRGLSCVQYTSNKEVVHNWLQQGRIVFARTSLTGSGGRGIQVLRDVYAEIPQAPLYTLYQRKDQEFRVHVFGNEIIDVSEKRRVREFEQSADQKLIRNHDNGWVFCHDGINEPINLRRLALECIRVVELDFGAVDIISNEGQCYILEVNTAPGIEGQTVERYANAIINAI